MSTALASIQGALNPLAKHEPKAVILRYLADEKTADIAQSLGVSRSALNQWLLKTVQDEWKDAQVARALTRKEQAEDAIETASDALSLARARELLRSAQWDLERVCRRIYGQDAPANLKAAVQINIGVWHNPDTQATQVIDVTPHAADSESAVPEKNA